MFEDKEVSTTENCLEIAAPNEEKRLPHSKMKPLIVHLEDDVLQRIRTMAEAKGKDPNILAKEYVVERLLEEEKLEGRLEPSVEYEDNHIGEPSPQVVEIYTDGGCRGNPGPGGWAAVIYKGPKPEEIYGDEKHSTNQQMELRAAIQALRHLKEPSSVRLHSDSAYLTKAMSKGWLINWKRNGWKKADKKPVKNADLWRELLELSRLHEVEWVKVKGHAGNPGNERCDALVQVAIEQGQRRR